MDTDGDRWEKEGGLWEADELDTALLRLVELVARASLSSRGPELVDGGSMMKEVMFSPFDGWADRYEIGKLIDGLERRSIQLAKATKLDWNQVIYDKVMEALSRDD